MTAIPEDPRVALALIVLNDAAKADPEAIRGLLVNRVPCNQALADHRWIPVHLSNGHNGDVYSVGAMGLLVGVVEAITGQRLCAVWKDKEMPSTATDAEILENRDKGMIFVGFSILTTDDR